MRFAYKNSKNPCGRVILFSVFSDIFVRLMDDLSKSDKGLADFVLRELAHGRAKADKHQAISVAVQPHFSFISKITQETLVKIVE